MPTRDELPFEKYGDRLQGFNDSTIRTKKETEAFKYSMPPNLKLAPDAHLFTIAIMESLTYIVGDNRFFLAIGSIVGGCILHTIGSVIYNLYFHPLSKIPGPRLAAATEWYETYFDVFHDGGGMFTKRIKWMHEKYGPIVRINPSEVHINDPDYHETIYTSAHSYDKLKKFEGRFNMPSATFVTADATKHKIRRNALAAFFAPAKIRSHENFIQSLINKICHRLDNEYVGKGRVLALNDVFGCLTGDMITTLAFARSYRLIESERWESPFTTAISHLVNTAHVATQFKWFIPLMNLIPDKVVITLSPLLKPIVEFRLEMEKQVADIMMGKNNDVKEAEHKTVFVELLASKLPPKERSALRMQHESISVIGAGFETTRWALTVASYHILANRSVLERLREELLQAIPDPKAIPTWAELSRLPYLSAVIEESLRLSYGVIQRSPRISRVEPFVYKDYVLPPGTPVSMGTFHMHHNEDIFPDSWAFIPERWLNDPKGPDGVKPLSKYLVPFGRGTRVCLGMWMAYCEIYLTLATLLRRFDLELVDTGREAVDFYRDLVTPQIRDPKATVKVLVTAL